MWVGHTLRVHTENVKVGRPNPSMIVQIPLPNRYDPAISE